MKNLPFILSKLCNYGEMQMNNQDFQFYPTPKALADRMWYKFQNRNFVRILEPSAGTGDLIKSIIDNDRYGSKKIIDVFELDSKKHPILKDMGCNVIGLDFLQLTNGSVYSHIVMNPPFSDGAKHVLHAWNILFSGEIVALVNSSTILNAWTAEQKLLVEIIKQHGSVEHVTGAFLTDETVRKTGVEVSIIHLTKKASYSISSGVLSNLSVDQVTTKITNKPLDNALAIPESFIIMMVKAFNLAVNHMNNSVIAQYQENYYSNLLGLTMAELETTSNSIEFDDVWIQREISNRYMKLKDRAWATILRSSGVTNRLSSKIQREFESQFETIKLMEFTVENIHNLILGLVAGQGEIQINVLCDVFDLFTKYHHENTVYFRGWKSNSKHRTFGMKIKASRIVLPRFKPFYSKAINWDQKQILNDIDRCFAILDGKLVESVSDTLANAFETKGDALYNGERVSTAYFDVRWYPGVGTIHLFPLNKDLVERMNKLVGKQRKWIPEETETCKAFWKAYENVDTIDKKFKKIVSGLQKNKWSDSMFTSLSRGDQESENVKKIWEATNDLLEEAGFTHLALGNI